MNFRTTSVCKEAGILLAKVDAEEKQGMSGDVWKVAVELNNSINVELKIINIDHGVGVLKLKKNFQYKKMDNLKNESFQEFLEYKKKLPIISSEEGLDFLSSK